jgi:predicted transcriptional regulator
MKPSRRTTMTVEIKPELEGRLVAIAHERSVSLEKVVEEAVVFYLNTLQSESSAWVKATQGSLPNVWPAEDFADWIAPDGR